MQEIDDPELFELFDYKLCNLPIYIDFKNWHETTTFDAKEMYDKIEAKANKCGCKCVIIINIITEKVWEIKRVKRNGLKIIEIPSLIINDNFGVKYYEEAFKEIRRCVNEYSDQN